jgi:hypothetical protein
MYMLSVLVMVLVFVQSWVRQHKTLNYNSLHQTIMANLTDFNTCHLMNGIFRRVFGNIHESLASIEFHGTEAKKNRGATPIFAKILEAFKKKKKKEPKKKKKNLFIIYTLIY